MQTLYLKQFKNLPGVLAALNKLREDQSLRQPRQEPQDAGEPSNRRSVEKASGVERILVSKNPENMVFPDLGETDPCTCAFDCYRDSFSRANTDVFCTEENSALGGRCTDKVYESNDVEIFEANSA
ncbi:hypothetical protein FI667_g10645, partial [Globisporangium splendens]